MLKTLIFLLFSFNSFATTVTGDLSLMNSAPRALFEKIDEFKNKPLLIFIKRSNEEVTLNLKDEKGNRISLIQKKEGVFKNLARYVAFNPKEPLKDGNYTLTSNAGEYSIKINNSLDLPPSSLENIKFVGTYENDSGSDDPSWYVVFKLTTNSKGYIYSEIKNDYGAIVINQIREASNKENKISILLWSGIQKISNLKTGGNFLIRFRFISMDGQESAPSNWIPFRIFSHAELQDDISFNYFLVFCFMTSVTVIVYLLFKLVLFIKRKSQIKS